MRAKSADPFAEGSKGESLHETSCVIWQVRSQLLGRCRLNVFVGCGTFGSREFKPRKSGDNGGPKTPLGAFEVPWIPARAPLRTLRSRFPQVVFSVGHHAVYEALRNKPA